MTRPLRDRIADVYASRGSSRPPWRWPLLSALFVVGTAIAVARTPVSEWNVLWAEDGPVFVAGGLSGDPRAIITPYSGYLHVVARLLADVATRLPLDVVPIGMTLLAGASLAAVAVAVFVFTEHVVTSTALRLAIWISLVALPLAGGEVANNVANLHWYLMFAAAWALIIRARSRAVIVAQSVVVAAAVLSDPLTGLLLPLVALRLVSLSRRDNVVSIVILGAGIVQLIGTVAAALSGSRVGSDVHPTFIQFAETYAVRVASTSAVGATLTIQHVGLALAFVILLTALVIISAGFVVNRSRGSAALIFAIESLAFAAVVYFLKWDGVERGGPFALHVGDRYSVDAVLLLISASLVSWDILIERIGRKRARLTVAALVLVLVAIPSVIDYRVWNVREGTPTWPTALREAAASCVPGADRSVPVAIAPSFVRGPAIPCDILLRYR